MLSKLALLLAPSLAAAALPSPFDGVFFEPNLGQSPAAVRYLARVPSAVLGFRGDGLWIDGGSDRVLLRFASARASARLEAFDAMAGRTSYITGSDPSGWVHDVPHYGRLRWRGLYPGIDAVFYGSSGHLEYDLLVAPGADLSRVRMRFDGADSVRASEDGTLVVRRGSLEFRMPNPRVYQGTREIPGQYRLFASGGVGFEIGPYDHTRELVVDPVFQFASYYGGGRDDSVVALTPDGDIVGTTNSSSFGTRLSGKAAFVYVASVASYGALMVISGSGDVVATSAGSGSRGVTVGGWTNASDFPDTKPLGGTDGFLVSISRSQQYPYVQNRVRIGGSGDDRVNAITGDASFGAAYFAGETNSPDLQVSGTPALGSYAGGQDAFMGRALGSLMTMAYYGGSGDDSAYAISGQTIAGKTTSPDLPLKNPIQGQLAGGSDAFIASINFDSTSSASVGFATYLGGSGDDEIRGLVVSTSSPGQISFAGTTTSPDFPVANAAQPQFGGGPSDAFAGRIDTRAATLLFATYIGGSGQDEACCVAVNSAGDLVLAGSTKSPDLPVANATQGALSGPQDAWYGVLDASGAVQSLSYFGGSGSDRAVALSLALDNTLTIGGETDSPDLPTGSAATAAFGGLDGFTARFSLPRFALNGTSTAWTANGLTTFVTLTVASPPSTAMLTVTSSDPSCVLVGVGGSNPASSISIPIRSLNLNNGPYSATLNILLTGAADSGEAQVTMTLDGIGSQTLRVRLGTLVVRALSRAAQTVTVGSNNYIYPYAGVLDDSGQFWSGAPAGASSLTVTYSLDDSSMATLSNPVATWSSSGGVTQTTLTSQRPGTVTVSAACTGAPLSGPAAETFTFTAPNITLPDFAAGKGLSTPAAFQVDGTGGGAFPITITSDSPDRLCLGSGACAASVVADLRGVNVVALADSGAATLRYSSDALGSGSATVQLTPPKLFLTANPTLTVGSSAPLVLWYGSTLDARGKATLISTIAPKITIQSSDPKVLTVPSPPSTMQAVAAGTVTLKATAPGFVDADPVSVTVIPASAPQPQKVPVTVTHLFVGKDLQTSLSASSMTANTALHVASSDPSLVVVSGDASKPGSAQIDTANAYTAITVQSLAAQGSAVLTFSATGYLDAQVQVDVVPSGFAFSTSAASVLANASLTVSTPAYPLDPDSLEPFLSQPLRAGLTAAPSVASSNTTVGDVARSSSGGWTLSARAPGQTFLTITQPAGFTAPSIRARELVVVNPPTLSASVPPFIGRDLQISFGVTATAKLPVTVSSDDPTRLCLSTDPHTVGTPSVSVQAGTSSSSPTIVYLQALADSGTVMVHVTADGSPEAVYPVALVPTTLGIGASSSWVNTLTTASPDADAFVSAYADTPISLSSGAYMLRPGVPAVDIPLSSTQPNVARPLSASVTLTPGAAASASFKIRPLAAGQTIIQAQPPASFGGRTDGTRMAVKVSNPSFTQVQVQASKGVATALTFQPANGFQAPGTILLTLVSSDPATVLLSTGGTQAGKAQITVPYTSQGATAYVQGIALGNATVTISAPGFDDTQYNVAVGPPQIYLSVQSGTLYVGQPAALTASLGGKMVLPGTQMTVDVQSSNSAVATVASPIVIAAGQAQASANITALSEGQVRFQADGSGFAPTSSLSVFCTVVIPPLPFSVPGTVAAGRGVQTPIFLQAGSSPVQLMVTSSDASLAAISSDPKSAGTGSLTISLAAYRSTTFYVQGKTDTGSTALTYSAPGFAPASTTVNLYPVAFRFDRQVANTTKGSPFPFTVTPALVAPTSSMSTVVMSTPVTVAISSSQTGVGTLNPASVTLQPGDSGATATFTPVASGSTTLSLSPPAGFVQTNPPSQLVVTVQ